MKQCMGWGTFGEIYKMNMVWWMIGAVIGIAISGVAVKRYYDKKMRVVEEMLEAFLHGKMTPEEKNGERYSELEETTDSRIAFLLYQIKSEILNTSGREKKENEQVKGLISDISHQFRTPLANIRMYEELLESSDISEVERQTFLKNIRAEALKSEWLLKNLVNVSRLESGAIEFEVVPEGIAGTLSDAVRQIYPAAREKNIAIVTEAFPDQKVYHNRSWTREVFVNILENALKYSPSGSEIHISVSREVSYIRISFKDRGVGIPKEEQRKIFERFYRCRNVKDESGSGLGLYLSRLILLKESGNIMMESEEGRGSVFHVFLKGAE